MSTATYNVPDMSCSHCRHAIEGAVSQVPGVASVAVDLRAKTVTVSGEPLDERAIVDAIDQAGYEVVAD